MFLGYSYIQILWYFLIYSFFGWCLEVIYCTMAEGKVCNRGMLNGPVCPIYGLGMLAILFLLKIAGYQDVTQVNLPLLFFGGIILSTLLELVGGWALLKIFHTRWWDYRNHKFNYKGYICLPFSIAWGVGAVFTIKVLHNAISRLIENRLVSSEYSIPIIVILYCIFILDFIITVMIIVGLNKQLQQLDDLSGKMRTVSNELSDKLGTSALEAKEKGLETSAKAEQLAVEMKESAMDTVSDMVDTAKMVPEVISDGVSSRAKVVMESATEMKEIALDKVSSAVETVKETPQVIIDGASAKAKIVLDKTDVDEKVMDALEKSKNIAIQKLTLYQNKYNSIKEKTLIS